MRSFLAAIMMFTRLPLWRLVQVDKKYYSNVLLYWPLVGFITGFATWATLYIVSMIGWADLPACILAIAARLLLTGALHEDGLADFFDGFGGGTNKEKILAIMKDSYIGSYGTIGLIVYFFLYASFLYSLPTNALAGIIIGADVLSKFVTAFMINTLDYARTEETSKTKVLYNPIRLLKFLQMAALCIIPLYFLNTNFWATIPMILVTIGLRHYFKRKIGGYTGDCCGASVLLAEQAFYLGFFITTKPFL